MRATSVLIIAIATFSVTTVARANTGAVVVYGKAKAHDREIVATAVTQAVRDASWSVLDAPFTPKEIDDIVICLNRDRPWPCVVPIATAKRVERMVVVQVELGAAAKNVVVTGQVLVPSDAVPSIEQRSCDPCSDAALDGVAKEITKLLLERTIAREGKTAIEITTVPPGASIVLDGNMVGASDKTLVVSAGPHQIQLQRSGYRPESKTITVLEGQVFKLGVTLVPAETRPGGDKPSRLVPGLVAGAGAVALVGGLAYSLTVDAPSTFEQPRYLYSGPALAVAAAGGVALGVGIYLWFRQPKRPSSPTAEFGNGAGVVGWITSF